MTSVRRARRAGRGIIGHRHPAGSPSMRQSRVLAMLVLCLAATAARADGCPPAGWDAARLQELKAGQFVVDHDRERARLALGLLDCLGDADPDLRDGIAFEAWSTWLRGGLLVLGTRRAALARRQPAVAPAGADAAGFAQPFSALLLSEIARTDRKQPWLEPAQRSALVEAAASYLESVRDYRGFVAGDGWRHGVAHGADLLMQLALNPALDKAQLDRILAAVATQVAPPGQSYVFGEPERLGRPVLFVAARGLHGEAEWTAWLAKVSAPPPGGWEQAFGNAAALQRRHDVRAFLLGLYAQARDSEQPGVQALLPGLRAQLEAVP
jgi:hypothetical protein